MKQCIVKMRVEYSINDEIQTCQMHTFLPWTILVVCIFKHDVNPFII